MVVLYQAAVSPGSVSGWLAGERLTGVTLTSGSAASCAPGLLLERLALFGAHAADGDEGAGESHDDERARDDHPEADALAVLGRRIGDGPGD